MPPTEQQNPGQQKKPLFLLKSSREKTGLFVIGATVFFILILWYSGSLHNFWRYSERTDVRVELPTAPTNERVLVGNIIEFQPDQSYIRFAVPSEGTYSIHITPATVVMEGDKTISTIPVDPLMETSVVVRPVEEMSEYDYEGVSVRIKSLSDLSVEERAVRLQAIDSMFVE